MQSSFNFLFCMHWTERRSFVRELFVMSAIVSFVFFSIFAFVNFIIFAFVFFISFFFYYYIFCYLLFVLSVFISFELVYIIPFFVLSIFLCKTAWLSLFVCFYSLSSFHLLYCFRFLLFFKDLNNVWFLTFIILFELFFLF